jgi:IclR family transcriptional regulator, acetate operon repressor
MTRSMAGTAAARSRGVSTARTVLHLLSLLAGEENGMRADEVADALGKSSSTAYNLLDTLCQERFVVHGPDGVYRLAAQAAKLVPRAGPGILPRTLADALDELFARTHKRVYLAAAQSGQVMIPLVRGRQGMPVIPGLGASIGENAHALGLGKIALSLLDEPRLERYVAHGLRRFTAQTIVSEDRLRAELDDIREGRVASDREEFAPDFCCLATPVRDARGRAIAALGMSMSARSFELERRYLSGQLLEVARSAAQTLKTPAVPAISEEPAVLERAGRPDLRSHQSAVHPSSN